MRYKKDLFSRFRRNKKIERIHHQQARIKRTELEKWKLFLTRMGVTFDISHVTIHDKSIDEDVNLIKMELGVKKIPCEDKVNFEHCGHYDNGFCKYYEYGVEPISIMFYAEKESFKCFSVAKDDIIK